MCFLALSGAHGKQVRPNILFAGTLKAYSQLRHTTGKGILGGSAEVDSR